MFETIDGFGDDVVAVRGTGTVTADDYRTVLEPALARAAEGGRRIRILVELGEGFEGYDPGAMWEDTRTGADVFRSVDRMAVVTDTPWVKHAIGLFGMLLPGHLKLYSTADAEAASAWIRE